MDFGLTLVCAAHIFRDIGDGHYYYLIHRGEKLVKHTQKRLDDYL